MITEYMTEDELLRFREGVIRKYEAMKNGSCSSKIHRWLINSRQCKSSKPLILEYDYQGQRMYAVLTPLNKKWYYGLEIITDVESSKGRRRYKFHAFSHEIHIYTTHSLVRHHQRFMYKSKWSEIYQATVPYIRNGERYEMRIYNNEHVMITKRKGNLVYVITYLHVDDCTDDKYKELFARIDKPIYSENDIYVWK